jgi:hypothetical protein
LLHSDVTPGDRLLCFSTGDGINWNWLVSGLGVGATLLLYDGSPFVGNASILFDYAIAEGATHFIGNDEGRPVGDVQALANPEALELFRNRTEPND